MGEINIARLEKYIAGDIPPHFRGEPGQEAYMLYAQLAKELPRKRPKISDLGTYQGLSALALSFRPRANVYSYDIDLSYNIVSPKTNIHFIEGDVFDNIDKIIDSDLILVDLDPHDGIQEKRFLDILEDEYYDGISVWDDIHLNVGMKNFWHKVKLKKEDVTSIGHHSGTGIIRHYA